MFDMLHNDPVPALQEGHKAVRATQKSSVITVDYSGPVRAGRGEAGGLYRASNGLTYFVPTRMDGPYPMPVIEAAEEVISNPTGYYEDMLFIPISPHLMARGLRAALEAASQLQCDMESAAQAAYC